MFNIAKLFIIIPIFLFSFCHAGVYYSEDKVYLDADTFQANTKGDEFHIHLGNNVWISTNVVNRDSTGMFTYQRSVRTTYNGTNVEYEKNWKCPYCYNYWPIGTACQKVDCPSKYK